VAMASWHQKAQGLGYPDPRGGPIHPGIVSPRRVAVTG
jgi:hypothetical protein